MLRRSGKLNRMETLIKFDENQISNGDDMFFVSSL